MATKGLLERLNSGEGVVVAEGYLFEFEARGYLKAGGFVPEVVLEHPEKVRDLHREFVHAGSDVVLAFTYYAHREKMRLIGREDEIETMNRQALRIAREVANETGTLMAGNLCNSTIWKPGDEAVKQTVYDMFAEQVKWAIEGGADFMVVETVDCLDESMLGLKAIQEFGNGMPAVVTFSIPQNGPVDGLGVGELCKKLHDAGAAVIGLNCGRGPATTLPLLKEIRKECPDAHLAALPVTYRTNEQHPTFQSLLDVDNKDHTAFPIDLDAHLCSRTQIAEFTREAWAMGVRYIGLCCGNRSHYLRTMAEALGRTPPASRYSPDMSQHYSRKKEDKYRFTQETFEKQYKTQ